MTPPPDDGATGAIALAAEDDRPVPATVLEHVLSRIIDGTYGAGARLPAERDWVERTGASRVSVREALSRLVEWGVIDIRRGSGAVVRQRREWRLDVIPAYLRHGVRSDGVLAIGQSLMDLLEVRRMLIVHMVGKVAERVGPGTLGPAREALRRAADARHDSKLFADLDVEMLRTILDVSGMTASVWVLNSLADAYLRATREVPPTVVAAPRYLEVHEEAFDLLEAGDGKAAQELLGAYLERHDMTILAAAAAAAQP